MGEKAVFHVETERKRIRVTLYRRQDSGPFHYCFWYRGKRFRESTETGRERDARNVAKDAVFAANNRRSGSKLDLASAVAHYLKNVYPDKEPYGTYADDRDHLNRFSDSTVLDLSSATMGEATAALQKFLDGRGVGPTTLDNDRRSVSRLFAWLMRGKQVNWILNPAASHLIRLPKVTRAPRPPVNQNHMTEFLKVCKADAAVWPVVVLCLSGLRPKGACTVTWEQIDLDAARVLTLEKRVERYIPLNKWAVSELKAHASIGPVWPRHHKKIFPHLRKLRTKHGIPHSVTPQALRRTVTMKLWQAGTPPQIAARIMGHSTETAQRHYVALESLNAGTYVNALDFGKKREKPPQKPPRKTATPEDS